MNADKPAGPGVGDLIVGLERLLAGTADRAAGWPLVVAGIDRPAFPVLLDYARENGFAAGFEGSPGEPNPTWVNPADGSEMVWVPPGQFVVGADNRSAECGGFSLARYPVTNAQFGDFLSATGYSPAEADATNVDYEENGAFLEHWEDGEPPAGKENHPIVFVAYQDALAYCRWAGLALPGEFLWEKAARGPDGRRFPWGDDPPRRGAPLARVLAGGTCPVGTHAGVRSPYGCEGLVGNVSEWCQPGDPDAPGAFPPHAPAVPGPTATDPGYAAVRGSAYMRSTPGPMRASTRRRLWVGRRNGWVGFRPALLAPGRPPD